MEYEHVTGLATGSFSKLRVLKDGSMQDILSLLGSGGSGGTYNDTPIWNATNQNSYNINANTNAIAGKHPSITVRDAYGGTHSGITTINATGGTVSSTTLTLPIQAGAQGPAGADSTVPGPQGPAGADSTVAGPQGPAGVDSTVPGPQGPAGADSTVPGPQGPAGADSTVAGPQGPAGQNGSDGSNASVQIDASGTPQDLTKLTFTNHSLTLGTSAENTMSHPLQTLLRCKI